MSRLSLCLLLVALLVGRASYAQIGTTPQPGVDALSSAVLLPLDLIIDPARLDLQGEPVTFRNAGGFTLHGWFFDRPGTDHTVLVCMGNTGNASFMVPYVRPLLEGELDVLIFSYQGFSPSEGVISVYSLPTDVEAAYRYLLTERGREEKEIVVLGISLGSILAISLGANHRPAAVAVEDVFLPSDMMDRIAGPKADLATKLAVQAVKFAVLPRVDPLVLLPRVRCPVLLLHGARDRLLPPTGTIKLARQRPRGTRVWLVENAGHAPETLDLNDREYGYQLTSFFKEALTRKSISTLSADLETSRDAAGRITARVKVSLADGESSSETRLPIQVCIADEEGNFEFARRYLEGESVEVKLETHFLPTHASAIRIGHAREAEDGTWGPDLSFLSSSLAAYDAFLDAYIDRWPVQYVRTGKGYRRKVSGDRWDWVTERLPAIESIHPRIRPRYARFLGELASDLDAASLAPPEPLLAALVSFLPDDPGSYYALGNASFQIMLRDQSLARWTYHRATQLRDQGRVEEAKRLLGLYLEMLPAYLEALIDREGIASLDRDTALAAAGSEKTRPPAARREGASEAAK